MYHDPTSTSVATFVPAINQQSYDLPVDRIEKRANDVTAAREAKVAALAHNLNLQRKQVETFHPRINATSEQALKLAGEQLDGKFSDAVDKIGEPLRDVLAEFEARVDFPEEEIEPAARRDLVGRIEKTKAIVDALVSTYAYGHLVKDGFRVLICGRPNAGKSSLLNLIIGQERAIVTEVSGTTRDLIEAEAVFGGYKFVFCDSAGITETNDRVEKIGVELARERIPWADLVLLVVDAAASANDYEPLLNELRGKAAKIWMITNKIDLNPEAMQTIFCDSETCAQNFYLSARTRQGLDALVEALVEEVSLRSSQQSDANMVVTNERQRNCLIRADEALDAALRGAAAASPDEIVSEDIRTALRNLEELVGKTYTEDILGRVFSKFCIGK